MNLVDMTLRRFFSFDENLSNDERSRFTVTWPLSRSESAENVSCTQNTTLWELFYCVAYADNESS